MKKITLATAAALLLPTLSNAEQSSEVQMEIDKFQGHFKYYQPEFTNEQWMNGVYSFSADKRMQYENQMEFPPFETHMEKGRDIWEKPFANGKTFQSCYKQPLSEIKPSFPRWNTVTKRVDTLESSLNDCLVKNDEKKLKYKKGKIAWISAYLGSQAEGKEINVVVPEGDKDALAAWNDGRKTYFAKRGQLNFACSDCHMHSYAGIGADKKTGEGGSIFLRAQKLSPSLGHVTHFPVWRGKWSKSGDGYGTLHRRFGGCYKQVRAQPAKAQSDEYRNLEYFLASMSNGLQHTGTEYRE